MLRTDWKYPGWVMSDWGAVHGVAAANTGLDQESGQQLDKQVYFDKPLKAAVGFPVQRRVRPRVRGRRLQCCARLDR